MDKKIVFEDYDIEITDEDIKGVDKETLIKCRDRLNEAIKKAENEG